MSRHRNRMRVMIVVHGYPPTHTGGAELRAQRTAAGLVKRGYEVAVVCVESAAAPQSAPFYEDAEQDGVQIRRLRFNLNTSPDPLVWSYDNPRITSAISDFARCWHPSVLHLFSGYLTGV